MAKRTGEVVENKGSAFSANEKRTGEKGISGQFNGSPARLRRHRK